MFPLKICGSSIYCDIDGYNVQSIVWHAIQGNIDTKIAKHTTTIQKPHHDCIVYTVVHYTDLKTGKCISADSKQLTIRGHSNLNQFEIFRSSTHRQLDILCFKNIPSTWTILYFKTDSHGIFEQIGCGNPFQIPYMDDQLHTRVTCILKTENVVQLYKHKSELLAVPNSTLIPVLNSSNMYFFYNPKTYHDPDFYAVLGSKSTKLVHANNILNIPNMAVFDYIRMVCHQEDKWLVQKFYVSE